MHLPWASPFCLGELLQSLATHRLMPQSISHAGGRKVLAGPLKHRSWEEPWHRIRQISTELQLWLTSRDIARKRDRNTSIGLAFRVVIASKRYYGISQFHESSSAKLWFQLWPSWDTAVPLSHGRGAAQLCVASCQPEQQEDAEIRGSTQMLLMVLRCLMTMSPASLRPKRVLMSKS